MTLLDSEQFEAFVFDLDSTLLDTHRYPLVASKWLLNRLNIVDERQITVFLKNLVLRYFKAIQDIVDGAPFRPPFSIVKKAMSDSLKDIDSDADPSLVEEATRRFKALHIELSEPYPGVIDMLSKLRSYDIKLGVLSNSFEGHAQILLEKLNLAQYFQAVVDCSLVRAYKPARSIFERVLDELGVSASVTLFIGDEYYADMVGAKGVDLRTVWINTRGHSLEDMITKYGSESTPDYVAQSMVEFADML